MNNIQTIAAGYIAFAIVMIFSIMYFTKSDNTWKAVRFLIITIMLAVVCIVANHGLKVALDV